MKAAIVTKPGATPVYGDFKEPTPAASELRVTVSASALTQLTRGRAAGSHYSSSGTFPFVAGVDGVGRTDEGRRVYFVVPTSPFGAMAEKAIVRSSQCVTIPDELDDITAAAIANPGMSSWAALTQRARFVRGETVLVNGATGTSGRLAIQIAKHLGAKKVIATGRNAEVLKALPALGANAVISLTQDGEALERAFKEQFHEGVDIVLDYLWGPSAECLLAAGAKAAREAVPIRFVQIGSLAGAEIRLPSAVLRSSAIQLLGSGIGSVSLEGLVHAIGELMQVARPAGFKVSARTVPLRDVEKAWSNEDSDRIVFTIGS